MQVAYIVYYVQEQNGLSFDGYFGYSTPWSMEGPSLLQLAGLPTSRKIQEKMHKYEIQFIQLTSIFDKIALAEFVAI